MKKRKGLEMSRYRLMIPGSSMWPRTVVSRELRDPMEAKSRRRDTRVGGGSYGACRLRGRRREEERGETESKSTTRVAAAGC